jgi:hypothetical protein
MLHAVYALTVIDEITGLGKTPPYRTRLCRLGQYGDVVNTLEPSHKIIQIPLDESLVCRYTIPNSELRSPFSRIMERYVEPASRELANLILEIKGNHRVFARLPLPPDNMGVQAFRCDHNDLSVLCTMGYKSLEMGTECQLNLLCGWFDYDYNYHPVDYRKET